MATTTNYGWTTPDDTSLVKDGAAAIRTLGSSVDTTTKALNPSTTLGDIEYRSATANTNTRLPIGTTGQVLSVVGGVPAWATAGASLNYTLANTGGTALTGSNTVTISGLTNANFIMIQVDYSASTTATPFDATLRLNTDSTAKYSYSGLQSIGNTGAQNRLTGSNLNTATSIPLFTSANNAAYGGAATILITGGNSAGLKTISSMGSAQLAQGGAEAGFFINGAYTGSSAISSISLLSSNGNWDSGTVWVYTSA